MMKPLRIALTKGRLEKTTIELLVKIGYDCDEVKNKGRRLILPVGDNDFEVVLAKAADVITYVEHGVCDLGVHSNRYKRCHPYRQAHKGQCPSHP